MAILGGVLAVLAAPFTGGVSLAAISVTFTGAAVTVTLVAVGITDNVRKGMSDQGYSFIRPNSYYKFKSFLSLV